MVNFQPKESNMKVSIFTPTHTGQFLSEVYDSIKDQPFDEWVILHNGSSQPKGFSDPRVREIKVGIGGNRIGLFKNIACSFCTGDILVELDHDDLLMPDAIKQLMIAFTADPEVGFVYSNALITDATYSSVPRYDAIYGWKYRTSVYKGHSLDEPIPFPLTPASVSRIWYAPDHVRAFRRSAYDLAGGYNADLEILDDQDLMSRLYLVTKFSHIDMGLYVYRVHGGNAWIERNKKIQDGVYPIYDQYIEQICLRWAYLQDLPAFDLGGGLNSSPGFKTVDIRPGADINSDLNEQWPFADNSVGVIRAHDTIEHLHNPLHTMKELYRALVPGGYALLQVPSTDGRGAFQDPTHVSYWNENSFLYYTDARWARYIDTPVRFQAMRLYTTPPDERGVSWTIAHLIKLAENVRPPGLVEI
jgi:glycosyltransferase involved in cell wall biosynthesis